MSKYSSLLGAAHGRLLCPSRRLMGARQRDKGDGSSFFFGEGHGVVGTAFK